jgi:1-deoxy-D-xylulose-5-phosphate reductoisomerase
MKRNIVILGATGSIGRSAVWVARQLAGEMHVSGVAAGRNVRLLAEQAAELRCEWAAIGDGDSARELRRLLPAGCRAVTGEQGLIEMVTAPGVDVVLCAIVGTAGLRPVLAALAAGKTIALASKEILVMAGHLVMAAAGRHGARILPVDSEHSAIFQCLEGQQRAALRRLYLTASGGPFRQTPAAAMERITCAEALAHPTWNMGPKVTLDSATLMNKGLEMIEAHWLFGAAPEQIEVVIHPQSVVHSLVEFVDGSLLAQLGRPDMRVPIQYALTWPERRPLALEPLDLGRLGRLDFAPPDDERFPALRLARRALATGGTLPAVLNAANEVAVARFMRGELSFPGIAHTVAAVMDRHERSAAPSLEEVLAADAWARAEAAQA